MQGRNGITHAINLYALIFNWDINLQFKEKQKEKRK
jgi:hypothetical protein